MRLRTLRSSGSGAAGVIAVLAMVETYWSRFQVIGGLPPYVSKYAPLVAIAAFAVSWYVLSLKTDAEPQPILQYRPASSKDHWRLFARNASDAAAIAVNAEIKFPDTDFVLRIDSIPSVTKQQPETAVVRLYAEGKVWAPESEDDTLFAFLSEARFVSRSHRAQAEDERMRAATAKGKPVEPNNKAAMDGVFAELGHHRKGDPDVIAFDVTCSNYERTLRYCRRHSLIFDPRAEPEIRIELSPEHDPDPALSQPQLALLRLPPVLPSDPPQTACPARSRPSS